MSALQAEHERSVFYPKPAPSGSQLHHKLLAAAAGAIMHGQFSCAQQCLEAAGEWETAIALAVCAGDFAALRNLAVGLQVGRNHSCKFVVGIFGIGWVKGVGDCSCSGCVYRRLC